MSLRTAMMLPAVLLAAGCGSFSAPRRAAETHPLKAPPRILWTYAPSGVTNGFPDWGAAATGESVFTPNGLNKVVALDASTGTVRWEAVFESNAFSAALSPKKDQLVVTTAIAARPSPTLFVLNPQTGGLLWNNQVHGQPAVGGIEAPPLIQGSSIYAGYLRYEGSGGVCAYDRRSGRRQWCQPRKEHSPVAPLVSGGGRIYAGFDDGAVFALNSKTGAVVWSFVPEEKSAAAFPVFFHDRLLVVSGRQCFSLDARSGRLKWKRLLYSAAEVSASAVHESTAYVGTKSGELVALNVSDGSLVWTKLLGQGALNSSPVVDAASGLLWIGTAANSVVGVSLAGEVVWRQPLSDQQQPGIWRNRPAIAAGRLFVGSLDKRFYALGFAEDSRH